MWKIIRKIEKYEYHLGLTLDLFNLCIKFHSIVQ